MKRNNKKKYKSFEKRKFNFPIIPDQDESISIIKHQIIYNNNDPIGIEFELKYNPIESKFNSN